MSPTAPSALWPHPAASRSCKAAHVRAPRSPRSHTWPLFVAQLAELLFAERAPLPIDLVGYSIGAQVAAHFAATHAHAVRRLVLLCPALLIRGPIPRLFQLGPLRALVGHAMRYLLADRASYASDWVNLPSTPSVARLDALHPIERDRMVGSARTL
jgi:pimeloyl-ACP methyl ester carboxylesterase